MLEMEFVLGAPDPEMRRIAAILEQLGRTFTWATKGGKPISPSDAYKIDSANADDAHTLVYVECFPKVRPTRPIIQIDHHRPGDHGFHLSPEDYLMGSSLGQTLNLLKLKPSHDDREMAAMDHCFAAAMRGECPGVTQEDVLFLAVQETAKSTGVHMLDVWQRIHEFAQKLERAPPIRIGKQDVTDLRRVELGDGYSPDFLAARIAAANEGYGVLLRRRSHGGGVMKTVLSGHLSPSTVRYFIETWARENGLHHPYGAETREFAGAYE